MPVDKPRTALSQLLAGLFACVSLALAGIAYHEHRFLGYPDGYLSHWDHLRQVALLLFIIFNLLASVWLVYLGWTAERKTPATVLRVTIALYAVLTALAFILDLYLRSMSGRGG